MTSSVSAFISLTLLLAVTVSGQLDMAKEVTDLITDTIDIEGIQGLEIPSKWLKRLGLLGAGFEVVTSLFGEDADEARHQELLREFEKVHRGIDTVRGDIKHLRGEMVLQFHLSNLDEYINTVQYAIHSRRTHKKRGHATGSCGCAKAERLEEALYTVMSKNPGLLEAVAQNSTCDRRELFKTQTKLNGLYLSMYVILQEMLGAAEPGFNVAEHFDDERRKIEVKFDEIWRRCDDDLEMNLRRFADDIICDLESSSNKEVVQGLYDALKPRFFWAYLGILVYDPIYGYDNHYILSKGHSEFFRRCGKNVVIFLRRDAAESPGSLDGPQDLDRCLAENGAVAHEWGQQIDSRAELFGLDSFGVAVIKRYVNLWYIFDYAFGAMHDLNEDFSVFFLPDKNKQFPDSIPTNSPAGKFDNCDDSDYSDYIA